MVDIDEDILDRNKYKAQPLLVDYVKRRRCAFSIDVYKGSIDAQHDCLSDTDVVIGIEIIEHLFPETLDNIPYNIFGCMKPKLIMFTTPNAEFNVLFDLTTQFRHYDHKFEWSREQFEDWATNICHRYPNYVVTFYGIGPGPTDKAHLGCCSQLALFVRKDFLQSTEDNSMNNLVKCPVNDPISDVYMESPKVIINEDEAFVYNEITEEIVKIVNTNVDDESEKSFEDDSLHVLTHTTETLDLNKDLAVYKHIYYAEYPFDDDNRSFEQRIKDDANYHLHRLMRLNEGQYFNVNRNTFLIPLQDIYCYIDEVESINELRKILQSFSYQINLDNIVELEPEIDIESLSSDEEEVDRYNDWNPNYNQTPEIEENWDI